MKGPDHPVPSGDRTVARLYLAALRLAGFDVEVVSEFRSYDGKGDAERQAGLLAEAEGERARLLARWAVSGARRPDLWFTYHLYHKAPDLLGQISRLRWPFPMLWRSRPTRPSGQAVRGMCFSARQKRPSVRLMWRSSPQRRMRNAWCR